MVAETPEFRVHTSTSLLLHLHNTQADTRARPGYYDSDSVHFNPKSMPVQALAPCFSQLIAY